MKANSKPWSAWRMDEEEVRVQINEPGMARAFARVNTARGVGYSVVGRYTRLFHVKRPVDWVNGWMRDYLRQQATKPELN